MSHIGNSVSQSDPQFQQNAAAMQAAVDALRERIARIAALANDDARKVLQALKDDSLYATPEGDVLVVTDDRTGLATLVEPVRDGGRLAQTHPA